MAQFGWGQGIAGQLAAQVGLPNALNAGLSAMGSSAEIGVCGSTKVFAGASVLGENQEGKGGVRVLC